MNERLDCLLYQSPERFRVEEPLVEVTPAEVRQPLRRQHLGLRPVLRKAKQTSGSELLWSVAGAESCPGLFGLDHASRSHVV
jgi:hypothetical protein